MVTNGLGVAGSIIGPTLQGILGPIVDQILGALTPLETVTGVANVAVKPPSEPGPTCETTTTATTSPPSTSAACIVGVWRQTDQKWRSGAPESGGAGITWTIGADGSGSIDYNGSAPVVTAFSTIQYSGSVVTKIKIPTDPSATSGPWVETNISGSLQADNGGQVVSVPVGGTGTGTWSCQGNTMTVEVPVVSDAQIFVFTRLSS
jgi:hypothetical protein